MGGGRKRGTFVRFSAAYKNPTPTAVVGGHLTKEKKNTNAAALITIAAIVCLQLKKNHHPTTTTDPYKVVRGETQVLAVIPTQFRLSEAYLGHSKSRKKKEGKNQASRYDTYTDNQRECLPA